MTPFLGQEILAYQHLPGWSQTDSMSQGQTELLGSLNV